MENEQFPPPRTDADLEDEAFQALESRLKAQGYDLDQLDRDNPYTASIIDWDTK